MLTPDAPTATPPRPIDEILSELSQKDRAAVLSLAAVSLTGAEALWATGDDAARWAAVGAWILVAHVDPLTIVERTAAHALELHAAAHPDTAEEVTS